VLWGFIISFVGFGLKGRRSIIDKSYMWGCLSRILLKNCVDATKIDLFIMKLCISDSTKSESHHDDEAIPIHGYRWNVQILGFNMVFFEIFFRTNFYKIYAKEGPFVIGCQNEKNAIPYNFKTISSFWTNSNYLQL